MITTPTLAYFLEGSANAYGKALWLDFENQSGEEQLFRLTYEIPKEFASSVGELEFSLEPSQVIDPDPIVAFDIILSAYGSGEEGLAIIS